MSVLTEKANMMMNSFAQLQQVCFEVQHRAEQSDRLWQSALDKAGIERYSRSAKYDDRVKDFYLARLRAVVLMHEAQDALRRAALLGTPKPYINQSVGGA